MYWLCQQQIFLLLFGTKVQLKIAKINSSPRNDMPPYIANSEIKH